MNKKQNQDLECQTSNGRRPSENDNSNSMKGCFERSCKFKQKNKRSGMASRKLFYKQKQSNRPVQRVNQNEEEKDNGEHGSKSRCRK